MEHEKSTSSRSQNLLVLSFLLGIAVSALPLLSRFRKPFKDTHKSVSPDEKTTNPYDGSRFAARTKSLIPPPTAAAYGRSHKDHVPIWKKITDVVLAFGTLALLVVNVFLARSTDESAKAAKESAKIAQNTLVATNRPWISSSFQVVGPWKVDKSTGQINVTIRMAGTNSGHSPAVRVTENWKLYDAGIMGNEWQELKKLCNDTGLQSALPQNRGLTKAMFPGIPRIQDWTLNMNIKDEQQKMSEWQKKSFGREFNSQWWYPALVLAIEPTSLTPSFIVDTCSRL